MKWYLKVMSTYLNFKGRARRKEFWMFILFNALFAIVAQIIDIALGLTISYDILIGPFYITYLIIAILPGLSVTIRRLHDTGKSGWMYLFNLIPIAGQIVLFIFMVTDSQPESNKWGPNPKIG